MKSTIPKSRCLALSLLLLCLLGPARAHALEGTILLGGPHEGWPPFFIPAADGEPATGIMPDVLRAVANRLDLKVAEVYYPDKRAMLYLADGSLDSWPKSEKWVDDPQRYLWTDPVVVSTDVVVYRKQSPIPFQSPEDLIGRNICVVLGYSYPTLEPLFDQGLIRPWKAPSTKLMLKMLGRGHVDGAVCNRFVAQWILREDEGLNPEDFAFAETAVDSAPYRFAFTRAGNWEGFIERFNRELKAMREDGRLEAILKRYQ
ncbi:Bacterial extracellular solute-binding protein, family 3 [Pseudodesulfovibrio hydrargyri]|uniref:Bacterial extracellular solute-binding protein, family 3 n=1 Tax=Pseudodesulfovibrio hydrargyri TaxID=2125990 RepID=A0A1J5NK90_9BACT|nr:transporter substrate-binding domain-containing protein [Pseudodesulfovibrio hydrargyri]OIQ52073.1 Bacterial extracellular solute-binding protein, family 3 [Pseudodesulfovibrio hydrargyri]